MSWIQSHLKESSGNYMFILRGLLASRNEVWYSSGTDSLKSLSKFVYREKSAMDSQLEFELHSHCHLQVFGSSTHVFDSSKIYPGQMVEWSGEDVL